MCSKWVRQGFTAMKFLRKQCLGRLRRGWDDRINLDFRGMGCNGEK
jgi:hypothetical protein